MDTFPFSALLTVLLVLLALSAFFSLCETAMMAANRYKLRHLAQKGRLGAKLALSLLEHTDRLLGMILLGNSLVNMGAAALVSFMAIRLFGDNEWAIGIATLLITFIILVFAEITPKIIGATYADKISQVLGFILTPLIRLAYPIIWFINLFAGALLRLMGLSLRPAAGAPQLTPEELRTLVMESRELIPPAHRDILINLFDIGKTTVEDIMIPRGDIEILDIDMPWDHLKERLATCRHAHLAVCRDSMSQLLGILPVRRALPRLHEEDFSEKELLACLLPPYYIPAGTPLFSQLVFFRENRQRFGLVVDEYGEILGLVTLGGIVGEIVGEFSDAFPGTPTQLKWDEKGSVLVEGGQSLRELNRKLGLDFPLDGPKTLNGLILEHLEDIPETEVSLKLGKIALEVVQTQDKRVKTARIYRLPGSMLL